MIHTFGDVPKATRRRVAELILGNNGDFDRPVDWNDGAVPRTVSDGFEIGSVDHIDSQKADSRLRRSAGRNVYVNCRQWAFDDWRGCVCKRNVTTVGLGLGLGLGLCTLIDDRHTAD